MDQVSLYVPAYNAARFLPLCLDAIARQTRPPDEVLVIDDGSSDESAAVAARYPVRVVRHPKNLGLAAARNTGFREASHSLVAALDADCVADPHWLERLLRHLGDEDVALVGGRLEETVLDTLADRWRRKHMTQAWGDALMRDPRHIFGNNTLLRKSVWQAVGGYDERFRTNGEDLEMSQKVRRAGGHTVYDPSALAYHRRADNVRSILDTQWRWWRFGSRAYLEDISLSIFARKVVGNHFLHYGRSYLVEDLREKDYDLAALDVALPFYMTARDVGLLARKVLANAGIGSDPDGG